MLLLHTLLFRFDLLSFVLSFPSPPLFFVPSGLLSGGGCGPLTVGENLTTDVLRHNSAALQVHEYAADGRVFGPLQLSSRNTGRHGLLSPSRPSATRAMKATDTSYLRDTLYLGDTLYLRDTWYPGDTLYLGDTMYLRGILYLCCKNVDGTRERGGCRKRGKQRRTCDLLQECRENGRRGEKGGKREKCSAVPVHHSNLQACREQNKGGGGGRHTSNSLQTCSEQDKGRGGGTPAIHCKFVETKTEAREGGRHTSNSLHACGGEGREVG